MFRDRIYLSSLFKVALPIAIQHLITSSLNMVDVMMIGQLGETAVAAVGLANQVFFLLQLMLFGISTGSAIFTAQYWGVKDIPGVRKVLGICLMLALLAATLFTLVATLIPEVVLGIYSKDAAVVSLGSRYLRIVGLGYLMMATSFSYVVISRSTGYVKLPVIVSVVALSVNTFLNYGLIFGNFGLPALGVEGAAVATVTARTLECLGLLALVYWRRLPVAARLREMLNFDLAFFKRYLRMILPVVASEVFWSLGYTTYNVVYARIGTEAIAAVNISITIENLVFVVFLSIANATAVLVGNRIGANQEGTAFEYARRSLVLTVLSAAVLGAVLLLVSPMILTIYKISDTAMMYALNILRVMAFTLWVRVLNLVLIIGIFRSGGDTRFALFLDGGMIWLVGVPLALLGGFVFRLPVYHVFLLVIAEEFVKLVIGLLRFRTRFWINNLVQPAQADL